MTIAVDMGRKATKTNKQNLQCNVNLFADDTSIQKCLDSHDDFKVINDDLRKLSIYGTQWLIL